MVKTIDATLIDWPFYVRQSLNEDHVLYLTELYEQKQNIPPITVYKEENRYIGVDGRHRYAAQVVMLERKEIEVDIIPSKPESEMIFTAFKSNLGGAMPPTKKDVQHTIELLMATTTRENIYNHFVPKYYDRATIKRYIDNILTNTFKKKIADAKRSVLDGSYKVKEAAQVFKVKEEDLIFALGGRKKGYKTNIIANLKQKLTQNARSFSQVIRGAMLSGINNYEDGNVALDELYELFVHVEKLALRNIRNVSGWKNRLERLTKTKEELKETE